jgi:hypothetical protein
MEERHWYFRVVHCEVVTRLHRLGGASADASVTDLAWQNISHIQGIEMASLWCVISRDA